MPNELPSNAESQPVVRLPLGDEALMPITHRPDAVMDHGDGSWLWDECGTRYLDFIQGWGVNALGHAPSVVRHALVAQSARLLTPSPAFHNRPQLELSRALARASGLDHVFFASSGAEANEGAIKLARKWGRVHRDGAFEIVTTLRSFHGRTLATMAASGKAGWDDLFPPRVEGFVHVPFDDVEAVDAALGPRSVGVMVEPVQGEGGVNVPDPGYLRELRALTRERGVLLMLDEVQTGMGRTGALFAFQHAGVFPDVMTLGKGLGAGVPIAALLCSESVSCFEPGDQGGTYNGNPLMTAVALAVLRMIGEPRFLAQVGQRGEQLREHLRALARRYGCPEVRGLGLLDALRLPEAVAFATVERCRERGLLLNAPAPDVIRFMPALTVSEDEIAQMIEVLDEVLHEVLGEQLASR